MGTKSPGVAAAIGDVRSAVRSVFREIRLLIVGILLLGTGLWLLITGVIERFFLDLAGALDGEPGEVAANPAAPSLSGVASRRRRWLAAGVRRVGPVVASWRLQAARGDRRLLAERASCRESASRGTPRSDLRSENE